MVTDVPKGKLADILDNIKSSDQTCSLLSHLNKMFEVKAQMNDDTKFNDLFEDISIRIKKNGTYGNTSAAATIKTYAVNEQEKNLLKPLVKQEAEGEPTPITQVNFIPDYVEIFQKLSWAGIGFGDKEALLINNSLRNLASTLSQGNVTFFGKIRGTVKDYYVAQATEVDPPGDVNYTDDMEKRKEDGVNRTTFYVTNNLSEKWVELPDIKPSEVKTSRKIRKLFTGNLNTKIITNPEFHGTEKQYLRCQIARILHGAMLMPSLFNYKVEDPETPYKPLTPDEKPRKYTNDDIASLNFWIHYPPMILNCGRVSHIITEAPEGVDPEEHAKKIKESDPFPKRVKPAIEDIGIKSGMKRDYVEICPWRIEQFYEDCVYVNPNIKLLDEMSPDYDPENQKDNKANYTVTVVRSLRWPGAVNVMIGKDVYFFYFGDGLKHREVSVEGNFNYKEFPTIPEEYPEKEDQPEPREPGVAGAGEEKKEGE